MKLPIDEMIVFGPMAILAAVYFGRRAWLAFKYRQVA
jgi:hypothetical protein